MKSRLLLLLVFCCVSAYPQAWSSFLDHSRAINWPSAHFNIPNYTVNCAQQPTLTASSAGAAAANATAIQNALASCDSTHNVVKIPAGTFYVAGFNFGSQGHQLLRGAGAASTDLIFTGYSSCGGFYHGMCMLAPDTTYMGDPAVLPPSGTRQCSWTAGYAKHSTTITLSACGAPPPLNKTLILDQANDPSDTGGVYTCDTATAGCTYEPGGNHDGRAVNGAFHTLKQVVYTTGVTSLGGGAYSVTISPGVYFTNIRSAMSPGAWWAGFVQNDGVEDMTLDDSSIAQGSLGMMSCFECWAKGIRFINGARNDVLIYQGLRDVVRDSYFYGAQSHYSESYTIENDVSSAFLIENNIFQQVTMPLVFNSATGAVVAYNFAVRDVYADGSWTWGMFASHVAGNNFNLFEGNNTFTIVGDNAWGSSAQITMFRNFMTGYQTGSPNTTIPISYRAYNRALNAVGNVFGQPGYHTQYQAIATSSSTSSGASAENHSIYSLGAGGAGFSCTVQSSQSTACDRLTVSTMMRWGNYDTVTGGVRWNSTEASPPAVPYLAANFSSSYFSTLAHTLPASLYYASPPPWWPSTKPWPPVGPDVSSGNLGICTGTFAGAQATAASQCLGGTLNRAWNGHANSIPAQDCYLNVMKGPPDGTGGILQFSAAQCYGSAALATQRAIPTGLSATAQ